MRNFRSPLVGRLVAWGLVLLAGAFRVQAADVSGVRVSLVAMSADQRRQLDDAALALPASAAERPKGRFYGTIAEWSIASVPLSAAQELERARAEHEIIRQQQKTTAPAAEANQVLQRLVKQLPGQAPKEFTYSLTLVDSPELRAWTVGGGFLYLTKPLYEAVYQGDQNGPDRLAFVLANEMGHVVHKHCRRGYELLTLERIAKLQSLQEVEETKLRKAVAKAVDFTGTAIRFLYEPQQQYEADLFACHLTRNAGFHVEAGLDVLRHGVLAEQSRADTDPTANRSRPSAGERLKELRWDLEGLVTGENYGLWEFDRRKTEWIKPRRPLTVGRHERAVVFVHGMDSRLRDCYLDFAKQLAEQSEFSEHRLLGFEYPADGSLSRVGEFLHRELSRACHPSATLDFVCHSAGGLVVRYHAEIKRGPHRRIILQGTPNHGSDWVALRPIVEMKQVIKDLRTGYSLAIENAILDGQGQIAHDLQPRSLFLNYLNRHPCDRGAYTIIRGQVFGPTRMRLLSRTLDLARSVLERQIHELRAPEIVRDGALQSLKHVRIPAEVSQGDLFVSRDSAALDGVTDLRTFKRNHGQLCRDPEIIAEVIAVLQTDP